jgi:hypothetical protein
VPLARVAVVIDKGTGLIVMLNCCCAVWGDGLPESVATTVKVVVAAALGVPEIVPELLKLSPAGNEEPGARLQATGGVPPELASVAL